MLFWVNACTGEVRNCRQIAAMCTVFLPENQSNETSEGSGKPVAQNVTLMAKGNLEHEQPPIQGISWFFFHAQEIFQNRRSQVLSKKQPGGRGTLENVAEQERYREDTRSCSKRQPGQNQRTDAVPDSRKAHQSNTERSEVCWKEGSKMTGQQFFKRFITVFAKKNRCTSVLYKVARAGIWIHRRVSHSKIEKGYAPFQNHVGFSPRPYVQTILPLEES